MTACAGATRLATPGLILLPVIASLAACERKTQAKAVDARPVRTITAEKSEAGETVMLTGQISAENEVSLAFRIGGRIIERSVDVGARVVADQVLARLNPQNELNALRSVQATLSAAEGKLIEANTPSTGRRFSCPRASPLRSCSTRCSRRCAWRSRKTSPAARGTMAGADRQRPAPMARCRILAAGADNHAGYGDAGPTALIPTPSSLFRQR